ncbi:hypothetical protein BDV96DRAFT_654589 [Lophiotrema nucula]|uniref:Peptidase A1 domain-containing protein n=1 Tax=Lophiotrema nucula TaxID=690887 RepID=A0A6A5YKA2_9PLEO|nr:hypothetical protein BDV96DRAFT_654589 [Lophiotrema nucula]
MFEVLVLATTILLSRSAAALAVQKPLLVQNETTTTTTFPLFQLGPQGAYHIAYPSRSHPSLLELPLIASLVKDNDLDKIVQIITSTKSSPDTSPISESHGETTFHTSLTPQFEDSTTWFRTPSPGTGLSISKISLVGRLGNDRVEIYNVKLNAFTASLRLESPYLYLPTCIYDFLIAKTMANQAFDATNDPMNDEVRDIVACDEIGRFPEIVFEFEDEDGKEKKSVINAEDYVMKKQDGCVLMVKESEGYGGRGGSRGKRDISLGWPIANGGGFVLDFANGRTGMNP